MTGSTEPTASPASTPPAPEGAGGLLAAAEVVGATFGDDLIETVVFRGETTLVVAKERILAILTHLRDHPDTRFDRLSDLTVVDGLDLGQEPRFSVVYHLMSRARVVRLRVRALVAEDDPLIDSVVGLFPSANWFEREAYDMFGIGFLGHPNLTRILMPDDWDGYPLRKDYPIGAEEIDFSFNHDAIQAQRPGTLWEREERYKVSHYTLEEGGTDPGER